GNVFGDNAAVEVLDFVVADLGPPGITQIAPVDEWKERYIEKLLDHARAVRALKIRASHNFLKRGIIPFRENRNVLLRIPQANPHEIVFFLDRIDCGTGADRKSTRLTPVTC